MRALRIAVVAGEASGDQLGASLLRALAAEGVAVDAFGVGGDALCDAGLKTLFPQAEIAVMGLGPVVRRLPLLIRRIRETAAAIAAAKPDILVTIDAPDFSKRVAKRVRAAAPHIPIVHWVCPSVWAWRPGRAPAMRPYIDHVLCLLPFEPAVLQRLGGPPGTYVGHPAVERIAEMRPRSDAERAARARTGDATLLVLPGSRLSEINRLLPLFLEVSAAVGPGLQRIIPTLPRLRATVEGLLGAHAANITIVTSEAEKFAAFRQARVALAASGTVTLELALAEIPMVAAYKVASWEAAIARRLIKAPSAILPSLVLGESIVPEFIQQDATADHLIAALRPLFADSPEFAVQKSAFARLETAMRQDGASPSARAARLVLDLAEKARDTMGYDEPRS